jgi:predicted nucleic acid-binding protein
MFLDTSVLVELAAGSRGAPLVERIRAIIGASTPFTSAVHIAELADATRRIGGPVEATIGQTLQAIDLLALDAATAVQASALKAEARARPAGRRFSLMDGIGLALARSRGLRLLTLDADFEGFPDVTILPR